jgi:hypothetical protein|tara:strand:- start:212 stop:454 length:243 start_codon:yes stop_codon:yes gene_type:complete
MNEDVKHQVVRNMVGQGKYAFISLKNGDPTTIVSGGIKPMQYLTLFHGLCKVAGLNLPDTVSRSLRKQAEANHNQQEQSP